MGRPKGSTNKTKVANRKAIKDPKDLGRKNEETLLTSTEDIPMEVSIINLDDFTLEHRKKVGIRITNKKTEFAVLANSESKQIELHFNIMKSTDDVRKLKDSSFDVSLTPEVLKVLLDYVRETPRSEIMNKFKKIKDAVAKSDKNANV